MADVSNKLDDLEKAVSTIKTQHKFYQVNYSLLFQRAKILMWVYLVGVFALKLFGISIVGEFTTSIKLFEIIDNSLVLRNVVQILFGTLSFNIAYACIIQNYKKYVLRCTIILLFCFLLINSIIETGHSGIYLIFVSTMICFIPLIFGAKLLECFAILIFELLFQSISIVTRNFELQYARYSISACVVFYLDYILLWTINLIKVKGENSLWHSWVLEYYSLTKKNQGLIKSLKTLPSYLKRQITKLREIICLEKLIISMQNLKHYLKLVLPIKFKRKILPTAVIIIAYFGYAIIADKLFESLLLLISYGSFRYMYPKKFHADYIPNIKAQHISFACTLLSSLTLCVALYNTPIAEISILGSIVTAFAVDWLLYVIKDWLDFKAERKEVKKLELTADNIKDYFAEFKTLQKYQDYLTATIIYGVRDVDWFRLETNRNANIDEQQYRNQKTRFKNLVKSKQIL